ncbi:MAG: hypothetical protein KIS92_13110 [Planctomycetota bacterium]|nr:hypothetical protein [Planctomycetota bacterium]
MANSRFSNAEVKAGIFLTFCLGLFVAMLFIYGKVTRSWRGQRTLRCVFTEVANLRPDSRVHYNGLEVGRIRGLRIIQIEESLLANLPRLGEHDLERLPLTEEEREDLRGVSAERLDEEMRKRLLGRTMVALELEVLHEGDAKRYREDDEIRISTSLMGEAVVEIVSGTGEPVPPESPRVLIGASGDMYSDLAKSLSQVKDIVGSMSEMVGGGDASPMAQKIANFETFTGRIDDLSQGLDKSLPSIWDNLDRRLNDGGERIKSIEKAIVTMRPDLVKALENAEKSLNDMRGQLKTMSDEAHGRIAETKQQVKDQIAEVAPLVKEYKEKLPLKIREAREWTVSINGRVTMVENWMTESDRYMRESFASARTTFQGLRGTADALEEKTWYLANYPWAMTAPMDPNEGMGLDLAWRKALLARHYRELRNELVAIQASIGSSDPSDRARLARVSQVVQEMDAFLGQSVVPEVKKK